MTANNIADMYITASSATGIYYLVRKHLHNTEVAVVKQVARRSGMECIVTRNKKDYEAGLTKVFLPDDFIRFMEQEE